MKVLVFECGDQRYGLRIEEVVETVRAVAVTPLPTENPSIEGVVNYRGRLAAVVNLRAHLGLPSIGLSPRHDFIVASSNGRLVTLHVDSADSVVDVHDSALDRAQAKLRSVTSVAKLPDGLIYVLDLTAIVQEVEAAGSAKTDGPECAQGWQTA